MPSESTYAKDVCNYCMKAVGRDNLKSCSQCRFVRYCSKECQKAAWSMHKKVCKTGKELREGVSGEAHLMNERLSKWINTWRDSLCKWSLWALKVDASAKDKLSTHCFVLEITNRPDVPSAAQYFTLHNGEVMPRAKVVEMFKEIDISQKHIDDWLADERGDNTVQIIVFGEGVLRFLWFSIRDIKSRQEKKSNPMDNALASGWVDALGDAIEEGDTTAHDQYLMRVAAEVVMAENRSLTA